jgi:hypothetical protein
MLLNMKMDWIDKLGKMLANSGFLEFIADEFLKKSRTRSTEQANQTKSRSRKIPPRAS